MKKNLRVYALLHAPFEGLGCISHWVNKNGYQLHEVCLWKNANLPAAESSDMLIIMGGPMSVHDEKKYPWLYYEKKCIEEFIQHEKHVLGICLGAQLIAHVLGSRVYPNQYKEIGWFPVYLLEAAQNTLLHFFPGEFITFHWHGDTFDLPRGAVHVAKSEACRHQAFTYGRQVIALQFHPEMTQVSMQEMLKEGDAELVSAKYVQSAETILAHLHYADAQNALLHSLLDKWVANFLGR
ncbi:MAG: amidotransferase [Chitinophagales bacterium]|nr:MAG: amidotransferase [Chitinophagales bacterium]